MFLPVPDGQGNAGQGHWIPVSIPLPHIPLPIPFPGPDGPRNAIAGRANRSRAGMPTGGSSNGIFGSGDGVANRRRRTGRRIRAVESAIADRAVEASDVGNRPGWPSALLATPGFCGRTFRVTERLQDGPTIPLDPNAASVDPLVRASSWRIAATGRSALDSTTHQGNRNHDKAADAATDPASIVPKFGCVVSQGPG